MSNRSPLKDKPLHNPGQSLEHQIYNLIVDKFMAPLLMLLVFGLLAGLEWWNYYHPVKTKPILSIVILVLVIFYVLWTFFRFRSAFSKLLLGLKGEKVVGQYLEKLREQHYQVFHDIVGESFNLDHVIIGPAGIFTIETKTYSKPHPDAKIVFDGETILVNGIKPDRDPVKQAKAQTHWLRRILSESTGRTFDVWPVIVFPGWWVEQKPGSTRQIWVLEPKALPSFLSNQPKVLAPEDVKLAGFHLSRIIRTQKDEGQR
ncbi:MAG: nuclease-related domain-containing protein [Gammaproteobacteria bacterium]